MAPDKESRRSPWTAQPESGAEEGWLSLSDDELLFRIEALAPGHDKDGFLLGVMKSNRHFFVRQEAAKKVQDKSLLKDHSGDRHIGQILVRGMTRSEDAEYLRKLMRESRHLEVRKAAEAQLRFVEQDAEKP